MSQDLVRLGIAATNMVPNQPTLDAGPLLSAALAYAERNAIPTVIADKGAYYFLTLVGCSWCHVQLDGVNNITIDFQGSDLIFTHPLKAGIYLGYSSNAVLRNFTVDYNPIPFTQVRVTAVDVNHAQIQYSVEPGWADPTSFNSILNAPGADPAGIDLLNVMVFRNGRPAAKTELMTVQSPFPGGYFTIIPNGYNVTPAFMSNIRAGDVAVLHMRGFNSAIQLDTCNACTLQNITVYSSPNNAVDSHFSASLTLERIYTIPKPATDRLHSTDGINTQASGPNNWVHLSRAIRTADDGFAFYTWITGSVQSQSGSRTVTVAGTPSETTLTWLRSVANGSTVTFQRRLDGAILANAVVVSQTAGSTSAQPYTVTYLFDRDLPSNLAGSVMYPSDLNGRGANSMIERNAIEEQALCCTGIDIAGWANSAFRGNYIHRSGLAGIQALQSEEITCCNWQTTPLTGLTFANNVIDGANVAPTSRLWWYELSAVNIITLRSDSNGYYNLMPTSPHQNITVAGNFIADPARAAIWMGNTAGGSITGNYLLDPNDRPDPIGIDPPLLQETQMPVAIDTTSSGVTMANNTIDKTSGRMFVTDTQYRELAAYAPGSTIRLNAYNIGGLSNPTITLTDADGNTSPIVVQAKTAHALDVPLPVMVGLGGAYLTLTSGNLKYFGTLFLDTQDNIPAVNGCTYETSLPSTSVPSAAANFSILVITQAGCQYQATDADSFVNPGASTTGTAVISVGFARNTGAARMTTLEIAGQPIAVTQAAVTLPHDFRAMGRSDAVLYDSSSGQEYTALSNGNGSYTYVPNLYTSGFDVLRTGDFNGDGKSDLVVYNSHSALAYIGFSNGDGTFAFQSLFWSPGYNVVEAGDLNGDGKTDFALYNNTTGTMYTGISDGSGGFTYKYTLITSGYTFVRLADFTGDGKADIFLYNAATGQANLGVGDGTGGFTFHALSMSPGYNLMDTGDLNGDGKMDIIAYNSSNGNAATGISDGVGGLTFSPLLFTAGYTSVRLADYTHDGKADVTVYNKNNAAAYFGTGNGAGNFVFQSLFWSPAYDVVEPQDVNGDGKIDVLLYNSSTGTEYTGVGNGDGTFVYTYALWGPGKVLSR